MRRIRAKSSARAAPTTTTDSSATIRRAQPRAVAVAARQRYLAHTQRNVEDIESPGTPASQDPAGDLSAPIPQRNSEPAVMPVIDIPVISALSALSIFG